MDVQKDGSPKAFDRGSFPWWQYQLNPSNTEHCKKFNAVVNPLLLLINILVIGVKFSVMKY